MGVKTSRRISLRHHVLTINFLRVYQDYLPMPYFLGVAGVVPGTSSIRTLCDQKATQETKPGED